VQITFKYVGQGDSIIIEWLENEVRHFGIVDCKSHNGKIPTLDFLLQNRINVIDFVILSHPHHDHYSGFKGLIKGCLNNDIHIKRISHTAAVQTDYLKGASYSAALTNELMEVFSLFRYLRDNKHTVIGYVSGGYHVNLPLGNYRLSFLAPRSEHYDKFSEKVNYASFKIDDEENGDNSDANLLSTIIKIEKDDNFILLTSDSTRYVIKNLGIKHFYELSGTLVAGQIPHHGARGNHVREFWKKLKRIKPCPIVVSFGPNIYNHPNEKVIEDFKKLNFEINTTGKINTSTEISKALDTFSVKSINEIGNDVIVHL
jgi:beta-lactamase superfamily II metal-dependent hydrolase